MQISDKSNVSTFIRPVRPSHIADLMRIAEETHLSFWSAQNYLDELKNGDGILMRLKSDSNATIGFVVGRIVLGGLADIEMDAEIYNIAVIPSEQNKGYGQMLFDAFAAVCRERNVRKIWLEVRESNAPAIRFYEKNGFKRVQTRNHFYDNPREHALLMKSELH